MLWEALAAALVGLAVLWFILQPLLAGTPPAPPAWEPPDPLETPRGVALAALKEIEFDRETGKLSEADYQLLRSKYTAEALAALRADAPDSPAEADVEAMIAARVRSLRPGGESQAVCPTCGPRPEPDAVYCSSCGSRLDSRCSGCGAPLRPDGRFCQSCGTRVAA